MAKRKTKKELAAEVATDINTIKVDKELEEAAVETKEAEEPTVGTVIEDVKEMVADVKEDIEEIIEDVTEIIEDGLEDVKSVIATVKDIFDGDDDELTKDIKSAIAMVKPVNVVAVPLIYNKFKTITKVKHSKKHVLNKIKKLISKK